MPRAPALAPARKRRYREVEKGFRQFLNDALELCTMRELKRAARDLNCGSGFTDRNVVLEAITKVR